VLNKNGKRKMSKRQFLFGIFLATMFGGFVVLVGVRLVFPNAETYQSIEARQQVQLANYDTNADNEYTVPEGLNFVHAAERVTPGVVHIRSRYNTGGQSQNPLDSFFRPYSNGAPSQSSGSGVIVSDDGYIVTNNHVIEDASEVEVILNDNRSYEAKVVGLDPQTDLALLKVEAEGLDFVAYGNSDNVRIGEWVLAVGNPFNLTSTVTAGIVSAKARNIGILRDGSGLQIESFIQTDAAVNPGNSGGALINLKGELVGINTAIATPTGTYAGYSFAVPVSLVKKVIDDLLEFGTVQRGLLGIMIADVNAGISERENLGVNQGIYVNQVNEHSAADEAGIARGDVIIGINDKTVNNVSELQEMVARNRPGDEVKVTLLRDGDQRDVLAVLKNTSGTMEIVRREVVVEIAGGSFENMSATELERYDVEGGIKIVRVESGKWRDAGIKAGFMITSVDKNKITNVSEFKQLMENKKGGLLVEGFYQDGEEVYYGLGW
jgi:Do/DeqQ family serine protease